ncbi:hypothetical protein M3226_30510 [Neobacillus cucumis]|uniref:hypothetical protein n=1 Tax=Neobacillus cucumis TaxID=1740721 RepID=UPI0020425D57|nr:hypothetical protein [Neobacillus cucumis]MCM3729859.1 hypothetical protein [Neobacillus cucumis]
MEKGNIYRKLISGIITTFILSLIIPAIENSNDFQKAFIAIPVYLLYIFPIVIVYGTITSYISDLIANKMSKIISKKYIIIFSALLHGIFGLILIWYSLVGAILFFFIDRLLVKWKVHYKLRDVIIYFGVLLLWFIILTITINFL